MSHDDGFADRSGARVGAERSPYLLVDMLEPVVQGEDASWAGTLMEVKSRRSRAVFAIT
ncbi:MULTISPECIES: hypothetical protein [Streptomyces]|uniref:hypothetical protein n=1 Tax=Streptomyces TaxID=1883 RepID=UPI00280C1022|nr:hypothetical protein [Streptomyces sp. VNUA74]WML84784.1 hypothetical protein Q3101_15315 [Streptomyces sp. VNUA74]